MYVVTIKNGNVETEIQSHNEKLASGNVVKGINSIDSFSFTLLPSNIGFNLLNEFQTLVKVYNTNKERYEFYGRVLYSNPSMDENGLVTKSISCESYFGFLCDSVQPYVDTQNWTVKGLLQHIIDAHNAQVEDYKHFTIGEVTVTDPNDNLYCGIQRENTWDTIHKKLIDTLGGELQFRVVNGTIYLDYLVEIGDMRSTKIALARNMKSITQEKDPSSYVTRLIPLGKKTVDANGNETEQRLDITSVNGGVNYIDDTQAIEKYGIHVGVHTWDDVTQASRLLSKGKKWLVENNKVKVKYSITALDLSLIGLDIDDFDVGYSHPLENPLLGIDDVSRIIKKNIDVCDEVASTIEVGESFKSLSDIQKEYLDKISDTATVIEKIESNYVTNQEMTDKTNTLDSELRETIGIEANALNSLINQTAQSIVESVSMDYVKNTNHEEFRLYVESQLAILLDKIMMTFTTTSEQISNVDGDLQSKFAALYKYITFSDDGITIRSSDSSITLQLDNEDGIIFSRNGIPFGRWDGDNFHTGNIVIDVNERAQFGNFAYVPRSDGSLMFLKVGDN